VRATSGLFALPALDGHTEIFQISVSTEVVVKSSVDRRLPLVQYTIRYSRKRTIITRNLAIGIEHLYIP